MYVSAQPSTLSAESCIETDRLLTLDCLVRMSIAPYWDRAAARRAEGPVAYAFASSPVVPS